MARRFDELKSRRRAELAERFIRDLQDISERGASPPPTGQEYIDRNFPGPYDFLPGQGGVGEAPRTIVPGSRTWPFGYTISQQMRPTPNAPVMTPNERLRWNEREMERQPGRDVPLPARPREQMASMLPPTSGEMQTDTLPPALGLVDSGRAMQGRQSGGPVAPGQPYKVGEAGPEMFIPQGFKWDEPSKGAAQQPEIPAGFKYDVDNGQSGDSKVSRFLQNVEPQGPISGIIALMRTAGRAAQGRIPGKLMTEEGIEQEAVPAAAAGGMAMTGARGAGVGAARWLGKPPSRAPSLPIRPETNIPAEVPDVPSLSPRNPVAKTSASSSPGGESAPDVESVSAYRADRGVRLAQERERAAGMAQGMDVAAAIRPHINRIAETAARTSGPVSALEGKLPHNLLAEAMKTPGKAASIANWVGVFERAARAKFSPQAKASLNLATRNLNNNLGTNLKLEDILKGGE